MRRLPLFLLLGLLPLAACDSAETGGAACEAAGLSATGSLTARAGGESFTAACVSGSFSNGVLSLAGLENLDGSAGATQRQINLMIPGASTGTRTITVGLATYADVDLANPAAGMYTATTGTITIDEVSASGASGSFSFSARNNGGQTVQVSGGEFDITF